MKKEITLKSYGKINLSLDVKKPMANVMHPVDTVMQLVDLYDNITIAAGDESTDVAYANLNDAYWVQHLYGYGRIR